MFKFQVGNNAMFDSATKLSEVIPSNKLVPDCNKQTQPKCVLKPTQSTNHNIKF
ncbi:hypothetical protein DAI22_08g108500 [Oryza sativa Japonica Group]|nr:hypothetical protein DAI22_08g108500 [Oryza sativa Japonica Group]